MPVVRYDTEGREISEVEWAIQQNKSRERAEEARERAARYQEREEPDVDEELPVADSSTYISTLGQVLHISELTYRYERLVRLLAHSMDSYDNCADEVYAERDTLVECTIQPWREQAEDWALNPNTGRPEDE